MLLHRQIHHDYPQAKGGEGVYLFDAHGKRYIDACGGAAVSCLGHQHPEVRDALHAQLDQLAYAHTSFFTSQVAEELGQELLRHAPRNMSHIYLVSGGSEAVEAALKMARQYFFEIGEPQRKYFIGRRQSYHGNTLGALAVGGNAWRRAQFSPILMDGALHRSLLRVPISRAEETARAYGERAADELKKKIVELGAQNVIAFVAETIVGATLGAVPRCPATSSASVRSATATASC